MTDPCLLFFCQYTFSTLLLDDKQFEGGTQVLIIFNFFFLPHSEQFHMWFPRPLSHLEIAKRTHRTQNIAPLTAKIYYTDIVRIYYEIIRGRVCINSGGIHGQAFLCCLSPMRGHIQCSLPSR